MAGTGQTQQPPQSPQQPKPQAGFAAGSEGWDGTEDPASPVASGSAEQADARREIDDTTQSDYALSDSGDEPDDGRYRIAEEQNFDQQSDAARRVGRAPEDTDASDTMGTAMKEQGRSENEKSALKKSMERSVPPAT